MQTKIIERYFFFGLLLAVLIATFFIFKPFWIVIVLGACFSVILYPIYKWFINKKFPDWLASIITVLLFLIILCGPLFGLGVIVFKQSQNAYNLVATVGNTDKFIASINSSVNNVLPAGMSFNMTEKISTFISFLTNNIAKIFNTTLNTIFSFILVLMSIFYFLKDGEKWKKTLVKLSPLSDADDTKIITRLSHSIKGILTGYLLIALAQGFLVGIGFTIFGVPNPALWGVVAGIASLLPSIGTALVTIPAIIFLFVMGHTVPGIGLTLWAVLLVGMVDNLLNPVLVGKKINIPPFLILFSVLGGVSLLGPVGVLIGPLVVSLLYTLVSIYRNEFKQNIL